MALGRGRFPDTMGTIKKLSVNPLFHWIKTMTLISPDVVRGFTNCCTYDEIQ
jgi:hypothetical protein